MSMLDPGEGMNQSFWLKWGMELPRGTRVASARLTLAQKKLTKVKISHFCLMLILDESAIWKQNFEHIGDSSGKS